MTQDDIIKLARESGLGKVFDEHAHEYRNCWFENSEYPELLAFAALVAALEREACAKVADETNGTAGANYLIAKAIRARSQA